MVEGVRSTSKGLALQHAPRTPASTDVRRRWIIAAAAVLIAATSVALFWPGIAMYDSVAQYEQALSGNYDDWHPPVMAWTWGWLHRTFGGTTGPMLALQFGGYWLGFGLVADVLAATGRWRSAIAGLVLGASPLLLSWQVVILKDAQMFDALVAAVGIVAAYWLRERRLPLLAQALVAVLLAYAVLVRANAVFAVAPLLVLLAPRPAGWLGKTVAVAVLTVAVIAVAPLINHRLFKASASGVEKTQPLYDLAGIGVRDPRDSPFTPAELVAIRVRHCVKPFFWDPLGDDAACGPQVERMQGETSAALYTALARAIVAHPTAYAEHRLAHWNSTERWRVPDGLIAADPPRDSEPNSLGLTAPTSPVAEAIQVAGAIEAGMPLGWPIIYTLTALYGFSVAVERGRTPAAGLALALAGSALMTEMSFLVVSIASDLRYHLWTMAASALAVILLADGTRLRRLPLAVAALIFAIMIAAGMQARATLPRAPLSYATMVGSKAPS